MRRGDFMDLLLTPCARGAGAGMMKVDDGPFPPRTSLTARRSTERRHEAVDAGKPVFPLTGIGKDPDAGRRLVQPDQQGRYRLHRLERHDDS